MDSADPNEKWCVFETCCEICGRRQIHVATLHSYEYGYVEPTPLCQECLESMAE